MQRELPTTEKLLLPLLKYSKDGREVALSDAEEYLAREFNLTGDERNRRKLSGRQTTFMDRIFWARLYLKRAGLVSYTDKDSQYQITEEGKKFLQEDNPEQLDTRILEEKFPSFKQWRDEIKYLQKLRRKTSEKKSEKSLDYLGVVVYMDALGTKGIAETRSYEEIIEEWGKFLNDMHEKAIQEFKELSDKFSFDTFSDTIIITVGTTKEKKYPLYEISEFLRPFILESMRIRRPIRGCISVGRIIKDGTIILGNAIDEASKYHDLPQWIGISASPSANFEIEKLFEKDLEKAEFYFQKYDIPLAQSFESGAWAVNWPRLEQEEDDIQDILDDNLKATSDIGNALKWRNTSNFFKYVEKSN